jgi:hypothetical protein
LRLLARKGLQMQKGFVRDRTQPSHHAPQLADTPLIATRAENSTPVSIGELLEVRFKMLSRIHNKKHLTRPFPLENRKG